MRKPENETEILAVVKQCGVLEVNVTMSFEMHERQMKMTALLSSTQIVVEEAQKAVLASRSRAVFTVRFHPLICHYGTRICCSEKLRSIVVALVRHGTSFCRFDE